jgi:hypothetical protein
MVLGVVANLERTGLRTGLVGQREPVRPPGTVAFDAAYAGLGRDASPSPRQLRVVERLADASP